MEKKFDRKLIEKRNMWLWGCAAVGELFFSWLINTGLDKEISISGVVDNDPDIQGKEFHGYLVVSSDEMFRDIKENDLILICSIEKTRTVIEKDIRKYADGHSDIDYSWFDYKNLKNEIYPYALFGDFVYRSDEHGLISRCCRQDDLESKEYKEVLKRLNISYDSAYQRKWWEYAFIALTLEKNGVLKEGTKGLGFAVGVEPLPSYFASCGVKVLATDLGEDNEQAGNWAGTNQNALGDMTRLYKPDICGKELFDQNVRYRDLDMNRIPDDIGEYDFCWSSCAIEHVGGLELSKQFLKNMLNVLKPGGIAVHTTEFNLSSDVETIEDGYSVVYRKKDIEGIKNWMQSHGHKMEVSYARGDEFGDSFVDVPPYGELYPDYHLALFQKRYVSTSFSIVIRKGV